jgi:non-ribosomal peptide synthetase component F
MEAAKSFPEAVALSHGRDTLTYGELVAQSTRLASYLIAEFALQPGLRLEP